MAVAYDAVSESDSLGDASFSWTHTPVGTPRGVLVFAFVDNHADTPTAVSYGGQALTRVGIAVDSGGEAGECTAWFMGATIPTGAQTVLVAVPSLYDAYYAVAVTVTASAGTHTAGVVLLEGDGTYAEQNVDDGSPGSNSVRFAGAYSGRSTVLSAGANSTRIADIDLGSYTMQVARETTAGQGSRPVGFSYETLDDRAAVHLAVVEDPGSQTLTGSGPHTHAFVGAGTISVAGSQTLTGSGPHTHAFVGAGTISVAGTLPLTGSGPHTHAFVGAGTIGRLATAVNAPSPGYEYVVELFDSDASFGPSTKLGELWDIRNLGWSRYDRLPGKGFFTLYQVSPHLTSIVPLTTHARITRVAPAGDVEVFNGIVADYTSTGDDVVYELYDYLSLLSLSRSGYRTMYASKLLGTEIAAVEWAAAKAATGSPLGFVLTGAFQNPVGGDGVTEIRTNAQFGTMDQGRLQLLYDLTEFGRANTANAVSYHITRTAPFTFNFYANYGDNVELPLVLNGTVSDYYYAPGWKAYRNDLASIGLLSAGGTGEITKTIPAEITAHGLRQDVTTIRTLLGVVGATTEADQQQAALARAVRKAANQQPWLSLAITRGAITPFDGWEVGDEALVEISNGAESIAERRRIIGVRAIYDESGEDLSIMVEAILT